MAESETLRERVEGEFRRRFETTPICVRSPGRVNLIGEHTDYNGGLVLPGAIDRSVFFAVSARRDQRIHALALDAGQEFATDLGSLKRSDQGWPNYLMGIVDQLQRAGAALHGFHCVFGGDVPVGAGLSSSAAVECGLALALSELFHLKLEAMAMVRLAQRAENQFVGVQCGIMDQYVNVFGRPGHVLRIDCRTLGHEYVPFASGRVRLAICDTGVRRRLAASEYNLRRLQCEKGVASIQARFPDVSGLRDVTPSMLHECRDQLDPVVYRRCAYVVAENRRVEEACRRLADDDMAALGRLMAASHAGLRDDYEVSCAELDSLAEIASSLPGVHGARMMGAGFGGCTINLIQADCLPYFIETVSARYAERWKHRSPIHVVNIAGGCERV